MKANISLLGSLAVAGLALVGCQKPAEKTAATTANSTAASTTASSSTETSSSMAGKTIRIATEGTYKPFSITRKSSYFYGSTWSSFSSFPCLHYSICFRLMTLILRQSVRRKSILPTPILPIRWCF